MRFNLTEKEISFVISALDKLSKIEHDVHEFENEKLHEIIRDNLRKQYDTNKQRDIAKKKNATKKATKTRSKLAKEKIENAVNILRMENRKITVYSVSKSAEVSFNTAKKYEDFIKTQNSLF